MTAIATKEIVPKLGRWLLGRRRFARAARLLWMRSRLDVPNDFRTNGELALQTALLHQLRRRQNIVILDVGANIGGWSTPLLREAESSGCSAALDLHLFEPAPESFAWLEQHLGDAGCGAVTLNRVAVTDQDGVCTLCIFDDTAGTNARHVEDEDAVREVIDVGSVTLDTYCDERSLQAIDFVKIDAEGSDFDVLKGAVGMLAAGAIRYLQFEYNHRWVFSRTYLRDVFELVLPLGYRVGKITPEGVERYHCWHPELESFREGNYLLWRDGLPGDTREIRWWNGDGMS